MAERSKDWFRQAESDLRHACNSRDNGDFDWSAFACHQAAEKAIEDAKAILDFCRDQIG